MTSGMDAIEHNITALEARMERDKGSDPIPSRVSIGGDEEKVVLDVNR